jgi:hypothetical protein
LPAQGRGTGILYRHLHCPIRCPFYTEVSDYIYAEGLCPTAEKLMPRLVTMNLIFLTPDDAEKQVELLQRVTQTMGK